MALTSDWSYFGAQPFELKTDRDDSYIAEIAPPAIRGKLIGFFEIGSQGAQMCGFWVNYAVNKTLSPECQFSGPHAHTYRHGRAMLIFPN